MSRLFSGAQTVFNNTPDSFKTGALVEGVKAVDENLGNSLAALFEVMEMQPEGGGLDNPMFEANGHDGPSPRTTEYFRAKKMLKISATIGTNVLNIGGLSSLGQGGAYALMWYKLNALFEQLVPASRRAKKVEYSAWYSWTVSKKGVPSGSLERMMTAIIRQKMYGTVGGLTQGGIAFGTAGLTGYLVSSTAKWIGPKLDQIFGQDVQTLSKGLHWFAFLEKVVGRGVGKGPSRKILDVIWTEIALGKTSGVTLDEIIPEPRGWLVIADLMS
jgi:hypothetical protein